MSSDPGDEDDGKTCGHDLCPRECHYRLPWPIERYERAGVLHKIQAQPVRVGQRFESWQFGDHAVVLALGAGLNHKGFAVPMVAFLVEETNITYFKELKDFDDYIGNHKRARQAGNMPSLIDLLIKKPSIIELIGRCALTRSEYRQVYANHDDGDEDVRRYGRWVCGLGKRPCAQDPSHWGPHDWQASSLVVSSGRMFFGAPTDDRAHRDAGDEDDPR